MVEVDKVIVESAHNNVVEGLIKGTKVGTEGS